VINIQCDGCPSDLKARVSFIARTAEFTPPVIYSLEERNKLVFMIEALPETPENLRVGQPVTVTLAPRDQDQAKREQPKPEQPKPEQPKPEQPKQELPKQEQPKPSKREPAK
jgi:HlyD family secretion protein